MADKKEKPYNLTDGIKRNIKHTNTFQIPTTSERKRIKKGSFVKLGFERKNPAPNETSGERMWVQITEIKDDRKKFIGTLDNDPVVLPDVLKCGDEIEFEDKHIIGILDE